MTQVLGRAATAADAQAIAALRTLAQDEVRLQRGGALLIDFDRLAPADGTEPVSHVGCIDGAVVGFATVSTSTRDGLAVATVSQVFVHPEARGVGVGAELLAQSRAWASARGCTVLESQVLPGNRAAKNFFERLGMVTRKMIVSTTLDA